MTHHEEAVEAQGQDVSFFKILRSVVSQLRPGQDITRIRLPSNLCYPFTLLEFIPMKRMRGMNALEHYAELTDPVDRMLCVLKWYLACITEDEYGKKPLNPVLGESFLCHSDGTLYISEQVSHHPPISAFYFENKKLNYKFEGHLELQAKFHANSVAAVTQGPCRVTVGDDVYEFTKFMPTLNCRNLLLGTSRNEYGGEVVLTCGDVQAHLEFKLQGKLSRMNLHVVKGEVVMSDAPKKPIAKLEGHWHSKVNVSYTDGRDVDLPFVTEGVLYDFDTTSDAELVEVRCDEQEEKSSQEVWAEVSEPIRQKNWEEANKRKSEVENNQRSLMEAMAEDGEELELKFFEHDGENDAWTVTEDALAIMRAAVEAAGEGGDGDADEKEKKKKKKKSKKKTKKEDGNE